MTMERGLCSVCLGEYEIRYDGRIRVHGGYLKRWDPAERSRKTCPGSGEPPMRLEKEPTR